MVEGKNRIKKRINAFDAAVLVVILLSLLGFGLAKAGHAGVNKVIEGTPDVAIDVFITGLKTKDTELFKVGEPSSITIRNVPVQPPMKITKVLHWPNKCHFLPPTAKKQSPCRTQQI